MTPTRHIKTYELEKAVVEHFRPRQNLIVPNVSWGFGGMSHEADLIVLTTSNCLYEIELKVSRTDLLRDLKKYHGHHDHRLRHLWFAVPRNLVELAETVVKPEFGIFAAEWFDVDTPYLKRSGWRVVEHRRSQKLSDYKATEKERLDLLRLCALRVWGLKAKLGKIMSRDR